VGEHALFGWDGERLVESLAPLPRRTVAVAAGAPAELRELVGLWAGARGLVLVEAADESTGLRVSTAAGTTATVAAGRDGWTASGPAGEVRPEDSPDQRLVPWLRADGAPVVAWGPGRVRVGWSRFDTIEGEPAAFAVSWSELLDEALVPTGDVVAVAERLAVGAAVVREPSRFAGEGETEGVGLDVWFAGWAALLALAALFFRA
jgi:hypothetical protein